MSIENFLVIHRRRLKRLLLINENYSIVINRLKNKLIEETNLRISNIGDGSSSVSLLDSADDTTSTPFSDVIRDLTSITDNLDMINNIINDDITIEIGESTDAESEDFENTDVSIWSKINGLENLILAKEDQLRDHLEGLSGEVTTFFEKYIIARDIKNSYRKRISRDIAFRSTTLGEPSFYPGVSVPITSVQDDFMKFKPLPQTLNTEEIDFQIPFINPNEPFWLGSFDLLEAGWTDDDLGAGLISIKINTKDSVFKAYGYTGTNTSDNNRLFIFKNLYNKNNLNKNFPLLLNAFNKPSDIDSSDPSDYKIESLVTKPILTSFVNINNVVEFSNITSNSILKSTVDKTTKSLYVLTDSSLLRSNDNGSTWKNLNTTISNNLNLTGTIIFESFDVENEFIVVIFTTDVKKIAISEDNGKTFREFPNNITDTQTLSTLTIKDIEIYNYSKNKKSFNIKTVPLGTTPTFYDVYSADVYSEPQYPEIENVNFSDFLRLDFNDIISDQDHYRTALFNTYYRGASASKEYRPEKRMIIREQDGRVIIGFLSNRLAHTIFSNPARDTTLMPVMCLFSFKDENDVLTVEDDFPKLYITGSKYETFPILSSTSSLSAIDADVRRAYFGDIARGFFLNLRRYILFDFPLQGNSFNTSLTSSNTANFYEFFPSYIDNLEDNQISFIDNFNYRTFRNVILTESSIIKPYSQKTIYEIQSNLTTCYKDRNLENTLTPNMIPFLTSINTKNVSSIGQSEPFLILDTDRGQLNKYETKFILSKPRFNVGISFQDDFLINLYDDNNNNISWNVTCLSINNNRGGITFDIFQPLRKLFFDLAAAPLVNTPVSTRQEYNIYKTHITFDNNKKVLYISGFIFISGILRNEYFFLAVDLSEFNWNFDSDTNDVALTGNSITFTGYMELKNTNETALDQFKLKKMTFIFDNHNDIIVSDPEKKKLSTNDYRGDFFIRANRFDNLTIEELVPERIRIDENEPLYQIPLEESGRDLDIINLGNSSTLIPNTTMIVDNEGTLFLNFSIGSETESSLTYQPFISIRNIHNSSIGNPIVFEKHRFLDGSDTGTVSKKFLGYDKSLDNKILVSSESHSDITNKKMTIQVINDHKRYSIDIDTTKAYIRPDPISDMANTFTRSSSHEDAVRIFKDLIINIFSNISFNSSENYLVLGVKNPDGTETEGMGSSFDSSRDNGIIINLNNFQPVILKKGYYLKNNKLENIHDVKILDIPVEAERANNTLQTNLTYTRSALLYVEKTASEQNLKCLIDAAPLALKEENKTIPVQFSLSSTEVPTFVSTTIKTFDSSISTMPVFGILRTRTDKVFIYELRESGLTYDLYLYSLRRIFTQNNLTSTSYIQDELTYTLILSESNMIFSTPITNLSNIKDFKIEEFNLKNTSNSKIFLSFKDNGALQIYNTSYDNSTKLFTSNWESIDVSNIDSFSIIDNKILSINEITGLVNVSQLVLENNGKIFLQLLSGESDINRSFKVSIQTLLGKSTFNIENCITDIEDLNLIGTTDLTTEGEGISNIDSSNSLLQITDKTLQPAYTESGSRYGNTRIVTLELDETVGTFDVAGGILDEILNLNIPLNKVIKAHGFIIIDNITYFITNIHIMSNQELTIAYDPYFKLNTIFQGEIDKDLSKPFPGLTFFRSRNHFMDDTASVTYKDNFLSTDSSEDSPDIFSGSVTINRASITFIIHTTV